MPIDITNKEEKQIALTGTQIEETLLQAHLSKDAIGKINGVQSSASEIDNMVTNGVKKTEGKNLFNKNASDLVAGYYVLNTNGTLDASANYNTTGYVEVSPNTYYTFTKKAYLAWYDKDKIFISGSSGSDTTKKQLSPPNAKYIRHSVLTANLSLQQMELGEYVTGYTSYIEPYVNVIKKITAKELDIYEKSKNLISLDNIVSGYWVKYNDGTLSVSALQYATDFIEVSASTAYTLSGVTSYSKGFYDSTYTFISGDNTSTFTTPANTKYVRLTGNLIEMNTIQLELGSSYTYYEKPYKLKSQYEVNISQWNSKKWATLGDSITAQLLWQKSIVYEHKLTLVNNGVGGSTVAGSTSTCFAEGTRVAAMPADADIISVMGGTNDWSTSIALGTISDTGTATFYGALNTLVGLLLTKYPTKRIFFMTTPYGEYYNYAAKNWSNATTNTLGLKGSDYADAIKLICKKYNLPYVDIHYEAGWNSSNIRSYITDDGGLVHPNALGASRISNLVSDKLYSL